MKSIFARTRWRLARWNLVGLALTLVLVIAATYAAFYRSLLSQVDANLQSRAQETLREARDNPAHMGREGYEGEFFALVVGAGGKVLENPQQVHVSNLAISRVHGAVHYETTSVSGESTRLYVQSLQVGPWAGGSLVIGQSLASEQNALYRLLLVELTVGGAGLLAVLFAAWFLSGKALGPIQQAFQRQQEFTADASHELRTPLTVMRSATDLLTQHQDEPLRQNAELLDDLRNEIGRLERMTVDLLALARSDAGKLELAVGQVELSSATADMVRRLTPVAAGRHVSLDMVAADELPVEADPDRIEQVLMILLDNAFKHTPPGGEVTVSAHKHGDAAMIAVHNTGEGIPPEHLERIFDRFYRANRARARVEGGAGLGLAIAKALVEAHGGQLTVASVQGLGTTATVKLKLIAPPSLAARLAHLATRRAHQPIND
ncbi:MAG TPA: HAMP domain-containing sensor histidine kinase [Chloroflexota bacterium]|nr:HAMP domain-containing sensor histidine kinase [Chloroflexota bacterium]